MKITACITTMNRPQELDECLKGLWSSTYLPHAVVVSDNSTDPEVQRSNQEVVQRYAQTVYLEGPHTGVTANRNNALHAAPQDSDRIIFLADDIQVSPNFFERAVQCYQNLPPGLDEKTILTGDNRNEFSPPDIGPLGVNFRGYFCPWKPGIPQVVNLYASLFPKKFLDQEEWDEQIFLGQEDIELSLRALRCGYQIIYEPTLKVFDTRFQKTTLPSAEQGKMQSYEIYVAASRLYIGIKRYKHLFPDPIKLLIFRVVYYLHMTLYLLRRKSLQSWPDIIKISNVNRL